MGSLFGNFVTVCAVFAYLLIPSVGFKFGIKRHSQKTKMFGNADRFRADVVWSPETITAMENVFDWSKGVFHEVQISYEAIAEDVSKLRSVVPDLAKEAESLEKNLEHCAWPLLSEETLPENLIVRRDALVVLGEKQEQVKRAAQALVKINWLLQERADQSDGGAPGTVAGGASGVQIVPEDLGGGPELRQQKKERVKAGVLRRLFTCFTCGGNKLPNDKTF